jgi:hypothetical protein
VKEAAVTNVTVAVIVVTVVMRGFADTVNVPMDIVTGDVVVEVVV